MEGFLDATSGSILIEGCSVHSSMQANAGLVGICPQHDVLWESLTGREHLLFYARLHAFTVSARIGDKPPPPISHPPILTPLPPPIPHPAISHPPYTLECCHDASPAVVLDHVISLACTLCEFGYSHSSALLTSFWVAHVTHAT